MYVMPVPRKVLLLSHKTWNRVLGSKLLKECLIVLGAELKKVPHANHYVVELLSQEAILFINEILILRIPEWRVCSLLS